MKFSVTQENLLKGLHIVNRIATTRSTLPILGNILVVTDKGQLKLVTTDLEIAIDTHLGASIEIEGAITVPARTLTEFVTNNTDTTIDFSLNDTTLIVKSEHFTAEIKGMDAIEFPSVPNPEADSPIHIPAPLLKEAITQTVFATTADETRPILSGVAFFLDGKELKLASTDSYRLAEKKLSIEKVTIKQTVIVPGRTLLEINRLITESTARVSLYIDKHQLVAVIDDSRIVSRLIEGTFPAYEAIMPKSLETSATMNRQDLVGALKVASLFSRDSAYNVTFVVNESSLVLKSLSAQIGGSTSTVIASVTGPNVTIAFNARFFLDALQVITSESVQLKLQNPKDGTWYPGILMSTQDPNYTYIIMPLRTETM